MRGLTMSALFVTIFIMRASRRGGRTANHDWATTARFVASHTALGRHFGRKLRLSFEALEQRCSFFISHEYAVGRQNGPGGDRGGTTRIGARLTEPRTIEYVAKAVRTRKESL